MSQKPYVREVSKTTWFLKQPRYMHYMSREVTCIFVGAYTLLLLMGIKRLSEGQVAYEAFLEGLKSPLSILFHLLALGFAVHHSIGWFSLTPKAMPVQMGEEFVADSVIINAHYGAWAVVSLIVLIFAY